MTKLALISAIDPLRGIHQWYPPLGLAYIASYLQTYMGFDNTKVFDVDSIKEVGKYRPDIVGISSVTQNFDLAVALAREILQQFDIPIIIGGVHITALPHTLPDCFDIAVLGEGEQTMLELMQEFERGNALDKDNLRTIKGIAFHDEGKVLVTETREMIQPLDRIPHPARDLLKTEKWAHLLTSRGCPYRCSFCSSSNFWHKIRFFSAEYVVEEIEQLIKKYHVKHIPIWDDIFIANRERLRKISELIVHERIHKKLWFACAVRANLLDEEICELLKKMNVKGICFGFESGSQRILSYLKKGKITIAQNQAAIDLCKKHGLGVTGSFIIGSPTETEEEMLATLDFIKHQENHIEFELYHATPFPGTEFYQHAKQKGLVDDHMEWDKLDIDNVGTAILLTDLKKDSFCQIYKRIRVELDRRKAYGLKDKIRGWLTWSALEFALKHPDRAIPRIKGIIKHRLLRYLMPF